MLRKLLKYSLRAALAGLLLISWYLLGALIGATWARNPDFSPPSTGVDIWVACSDIHSDLVVPVKNEFYDWSKLVARAHARRVDPGYSHLAIGWGDRKFYLETPTWSDVKATNVLSAFCGLDDTAMHVDWLPGAPRTGPTCRRLRLSSTGYQEMCRFISASFSVTEGHSQPIDAPGYTDTDAFYEAVGRYTAIQTCNTWTGQALAAGGARVGCWTPMKWGVLWQLESPDPG